MYRLLTDPSITLVEFTDEYIKDCTCNFAKESKVAEGAFGTVFHGVDSQDVKLKFVIKRPTLKFSSPSSIQTMHDTFSSDVVVRSYSQTCSCVFFFRKNILCLKTVHNFFVIY